MSADLKCWIHSRNSDVFGHDTTIGLISLPDNDKSEFSIRSSLCRNMSTFRVEFPGLV